MRTVAKYPMTAPSERLTVREAAVPVAATEWGNRLCVAPDEGEDVASFRLVDSLGLSSELVRPLNTLPAATSSVTAETIFGSQSVLVVERQPIQPERVSLTDNAVFQGFVLLLAAAYGMLLYHCLGEIRMLLMRISRDTNSGERFYDNSSNNGFSRFLNTVTTVGVLFLGVMVVKYGDSLLSEQLLAQLPDAAVLGLSLLMSVIFLIIFLAQWGLLSAIGALTLSRPFIAQLQQLRRTFFALIVVMIAPVLLLFALCPRGTGEMWFLLIIIELAVTSFLYFKETLSLFMSKKISILHWFLYLCSVEIFPVSLAWLVIAR